MANLVLDRIIELFEPVIVVGTTGQRETSYVSQGEVHAAFNPMSGNSTDLERLYTAQEVDVFYVRDGGWPITPQWLIKYEGKEYDILSVMERQGDPGVRPRGRYTALKARWRNTDELLT